jgi:hypothetical protein
MKKVVLFACLVAGMALASAKSFTVTLFEPSLIGGTELQAGDYELQLRDQNQKIVIKHGRATTEASVKVETVDSKFPTTSVRYAEAEGKNKVEEIRLGGTNLKLLLE